MRRDPQARGRTPSAQVRRASSVPYPRPSRHTRARLPPSGFPPQRARRLTPNQPRPGQDQDPRAQRPPTLGASYLAVLSGTVSWPRTSSRVMLRLASSKLSTRGEGGADASEDKKVYCPNRRAYHQLVRLGAAARPYIGWALGTASWREPARPLARARFLMQMRRRPEARARRPRGEGCGG